MILLYFGCSDNITLEMAYQQNSNEKLNQFLKNWINEYKPLTDNERKKLSPFEQNGYSIYEEFYKQNSYFVDSLTSGSLYRKTKYFLVQNNLYIFLYDELDMQENIMLSLDGLSDRSYEKIIVNDFRPIIKNPDYDVLYITDKYREILREFLLGEYDNVYNIEVNTEEIDEVLNRVRFLNRELSVFPSHWLSPWRIESHPVIESIKFDKNFNNAIVSYNIEYYGKAVIFKKIDDLWKMGKSEIVWSQ